jgi:uncharacterized membrane protein
MSTAVNTTQPPTQAAQRRSTLRILSFVFMFVAMIVSGYLAYAKFTSGEVACPANASLAGIALNCSAVESSVYARILGFPTAAWGFITYTIIVILLFLEKRSAFMREYGLLLIFGINLFAFAYHCYLTYTAAYVIRALCPWCLTAHAMVTLLLIVTSIRLWRALKAA